MKYREAISHGNRCEFNRYECKFKCGEKLLGLDMQKHLPLCPKSYVECEGCLEKLYNVTRDEETHDCIAVLKSRLRPTKPFNILGVEHVNTCKNNHTVQRMTDRPSYYGGSV